MSEWGDVALGEVATDDGFAIGPFGSRMKSENYTEHGIRVVRGQNLTPDGRIGGEFVYVSKEFADSLASARLRPGDLALPHRGAIGRVALVTDDDMVMSTSLMRARLDKDLADPRFVASFLCSPEGGRRILQFASTVGTPGIGQPLTSLRQVRIPCPPIAEQRRIASLLGALDDLIETERELRAKALELAQAFYLDAVAGSVTEVTLRDVGKWLSGGTPSTSISEYWGGELPWISASSLQTFFLRSSGRTLTPEGASSGTRIVPAGSILFVVRGMSLKTEFRVGVAQRDIAFGQDCKAIIVDGRMPRATVAVGLLANSDAVLQLVDEAGHGTGRLPTDRIERLPIRLPDTASIASVERVLDSLLRLGADSEESIADLTRTRDQLLPLLMSGRVRVTDVEGVTVGVDAY